MTNAQAVAHVISELLGRRPTAHEIELASVVLAVFAPDLDSAAEYEGIDLDLVTAYALGMSDTPDTTPDPLEPNEPNEPPEQDDNDRRVTRTTETIEPA